MIQTPNAIPDQQVRKKGTGFTNINKYLDANQNNKLGSTIQSGISGQSTQAKDALNQQKTAFQEQSESNRLGTEADTQKRTSIMDRFSTSSGFTGPSDDEVKEFEKFRSGEYKGPTELDQGQKAIAAAKAQEAENLGKLTQTSGGRQGLLQRFVGAPGYNQGQQKVDTLLLGKTGANQIKQARRDTLGLSGQVSEADQAARARGQQLTGEAQEFGRQTVEGLNQTRDPLEALLGKQAEDKLASGQANREAILAKIKAEEGLSDEELTSLGLTPQQVQQYKMLQNVSGQRYVQSADISGSRLVGNNVQDSSGASVVGKAALDKYNQDVQNLTSTLNQKKQQLASGQMVVLPGQSSPGQFTPVYGYDPKTNKLILTNDLKSSAGNLQAAAGQMKYDLNDPNQLQAAIKEYPSLKTLLDLQTQSPEQIARQVYSTDTVGGKTNTIYNSGVYGGTTTNGTGAGWSQYGANANPFGQSSIYSYQDVSGVLEGAELANLLANAKEGDPVSVELANQLGLLSDQGFGSQAKINKLNYSERPDFEFERYLSNFDPSSITRETAAQQDQLAKANALERLLGKQAQYDTSKAGTASTDVKLDQTVINDALRDLFQGEAKINDLGLVEPTTDIAAQRLRGGIEAGIKSTPLLDQFNWYTGGKFGEVAGDLGEFGNEAWRGIRDDVPGVKPLVTLGEKAIGGFANSVGSRLSKVAGTVICTELYRQGLMSKEIYQKDQAYGEHFIANDPEVYYGYALWATPIAKGMAKSKLLTNIMKPFALAWANQMAGNNNNLGRAILWIGVPICRLIGRYIC